MKDREVIIRAINNYPTYKHIRQGKRYAIIHTKSEYPHLLQVLVRGGNHKSVGENAWNIMNDLETMFGVETAYITDRANNVIITL